MGLNIIKNKLYSIKLKISKNLFSILNDTYIKDRKNKEIIKFNKKRKSFELNWLKFKEKSYYFLNIIEKKIIC